MPRIEARVGRGGRVKVDFVGFSKDNCLAEAAVLEAALAELGLVTSLVERSPKSEKQIQEEIGEEASRSADPEGTR
ncbi:MAG: hypothetical protein AB1576_13495 [Bacillota bacterium]|jgi:hypothetical protein